VLGRAAASRGLGSAPGCTKRISPSNKETDLSNSTKRIATAASALAMGLAIACPAIAQEKIKVGVLATYSGPSGLAGQQADNVIKMFQQKNGTSVAGKTVEFVRRDTTGPNPEVAKRLAQEMFVREKVQILIGPDFTANVLAVTPLINEAKVPTILTGAATGGIVGERSPYLARTFFVTRQVVAPMAQWALKNGVKRPYLVVADFPPGHEAEEIFAKTYAEAGGSLAGTTRISLRSPEFSPYMQRIKDANPDAVFAFLPVGDLVIQFVKTFADSGLKSSGVKLLGTSDISDESLLDAIGDAALGTITTGWYSTSHDSRLSKQFVGDYQAQFGSNPRLGSVQVAFWDALRLIYDGIAAQGNAPFDGEKFMAFVKGRSFESPRGRISIDKVNGDITQDVHIRRVERRDGQLVNVEFETFPAVAPK
jgi:branched-chain amino acid transport system substrate-binding protein